MNKLWFKKKSGVHGSGLFASQNIKKGLKIIEYVGDKVTKKEGDRRADIQINKAKENRSLKIGDDLLDRDVLFYSPAEGPMEFPSSMEVKEFSTVTINGKKIDVIVANGKEITYHSSGKSEVEVEVLIHRYTGLIIGLSFSGSASAGNERGTFSFSFFANDVSEHFTEKPILVDFCIAAEKAAQAEQEKERK